MVLSETWKAAPVMFTSHVNTPSIVAMIYNLKKTGNQKGSVYLSVAFMSIFRILVRDIFVFCNALALSATV